MTTAPNRFGVSDNFGSGGQGLAPDGASSDVTPINGVPQFLRDLLRTILGANWGPGYANAAALTASLAINRQDGQFALKLDDYSLWVWKNADATAADATHIQPSDTSGAGRWVQTVAPTPDGGEPSFAKGTTTLVAGVSPAVSVPGLASTSKILVSRRDKNASTALGVPAVLTADIVTGGSGSFKVRALAVADGTAVTADVSTFDWLVAL